MAFHKPHRSVYAPVRQLAIAISIASVLFLVTRQLPVLQLSPSSLDHTSKYAQRDKPHTALRSLPKTLHHQNQCIPYIFYDKPVKTGSTAITHALTKYLASRSDPPTPCVGIVECSRVTEHVCTGARRPAHLIQHVSSNASITACLRRNGFYHVTSIREPKQRIISAWRFSLTKKENHYGIPFNATFAQFLHRFPRCSLYTYYDLLPGRCTREQAERRVEEIVSRFDEIIDLSDDAITDVHQRIHPFLKHVNVAPSGRAKTGELQVPDDVVEQEYLLYNKLREKRSTLANTPRRILCER